MEIGTKLGKFCQVSFQNLAVKNERIFKQKLVVLTKFHFVLFCKIPKYFLMQEYRNYLITCETFIKHKRSLSISLLDTT
jgi:hypothetical protein